MNGEPAAVAIRLDARGGNVAVDVAPANSVRDEKGCVI